MNYGIINQALDYIADHMCEMKLLWTNSSPNSSFASQTVQLDLSDYDAVMVEARLYAGNDTIAPPSFAKIGGGASILVAVAGRNGISGGRLDGQAFFVSRRFDASTNGVGFGIGAYALLDANWSGNNDQMIPYRIYGIKFKP